MVADCSTPARQPHEMHGHRGWTDELMAPATSVSRQSVDDDDRRFRMSAVGFLLDTLVLCHAHNDTLGHTTGIGFALVRITSAVPGAVESCVPMSDASIDKPSGSIQHGLQSVLQISRDTRKN